MTISMFQASVPPIKTALSALSDVLGKGAAFAEAKKIEPSVLITDRLAADMLPLSKQVQIATDIAKGGVARLAGIEIPSYDDNETTFDELRARIAKTIRVHRHDHAPLRSTVARSARSRSRCAPATCISSASAICSASSCRTCCSIARPPTTSSATTASRSASGDFLGGF